MTTPDYDIFRKDPLGALAWVEAASDVQEAKARIEELAADDPGEYIVFSQRGQLVIAASGGKVRMRAGD
jgi:hypothetical protein